MPPSCTSQQPTNKRDVEFGVSGQARTVGKTAKRGNAREDRIRLPTGQLLFDRKTQSPKLLPEFLRHQEDCCTTGLDVDQPMIPGRDHDHHGQLQQLQS
jgi:hypothetical protein